MTSRADEIRARLLRAKYAGPPQFTDANDHNPEILAPCPACGGRGTICHEADGVATLDPCSACDGTGTTLEVVRYFSTVWPELAAAPGDDGWLTCPRCGARFSPADRRVWTGRRHACGQAIRIT